MPLQAYYYVNVIPGTCFTISREAKSNTRCFRLTYIIAMPDTSKRIILKANSLNKPVNLMTKSVTLTRFLIARFSAVSNALSYTAASSPGSSGGRRSGSIQGTQGRKSLHRSEVRQDQAVMDMPFLQAHWWKLLLW